jgi:hypothetical protein
MREEQLQKLSAAPIFIEFTGVPVRISPGLECLFGFFASAFLHFVSQRLSLMIIK